MYDGNSVIVSCNALEHCQHFPLIAHRYLLVREARSDGAQKTDARGRENREENGFASISLKEAKRV